MLWTTWMGKRVVLSCGTKAVTEQNGTSVVVKSNHQQVMLLLFLFLLFLLLVCALLFVVLVLVGCWCDSEHEWRNKQEIAKVRPNHHWRMYFTQRNTYNRSLNPIGSTWNDVYSLKKFHEVFEKSLTIVLPYTGQSQKRGGKGLSQMHSSWTIHGCNQTHVSLQHHDNLRE